MSTRRIEQAVVEPAETVKQETKFRVDTVSYTHLTLPTILRV